MIHPTKIALTLISPPLAALSAWLVASAGKYGLHLDQSGVNALAVSGAAGALGLIAKLIHDVERRYPSAARRAETFLEDAVLAYGADKSPEPYQPPPVTPPPAAAAASSAGAGWPPAG